MKKSRPPTELFPERLRSARAKRELSQEGLAKRANLQASAISHFETGTRKPSFDNLRRLADALDVTTDYLLGRVDETQDLASADRLYRHLDQLSSGDREMAEGIVEFLASKAKGNTKKEDE
ncbi:helix-turn-helix domain-containing protein [Acidobacteria bacterium AH-259-O06]|nr:helix-turn-helix domain-containing protein [Acidobacteria bacterium AH-259-O06]